jgi:DNA-binding HxlR family transcriptional regulator
MVTMTTGAPIADPLTARGDLFDPACPTRVVLDRIGDKWTVLVIGALIDGPLRFTQVRQRVGGVAPKVLTQTLRAMERDGLLTRTVYAQVPPRVDYALTELGISLAEPLAVLTDWAEAHVGQIVASRDGFEAADLARNDSEPVGVGR